MKYSSKIDPRLVQIKEINDELHRLWDLRLDTNRRIDELQDDLSKIIVDIQDHPYEAGETDESERGNTDARNAVGS